MAFNLVNRVRESCISPGTATVVLAGAALGYQTFSAGVGANNTTYYVIADQSGANWEVGYGTVGALGTTLARTTVLSSSNAGSLVNFSSGTQDVWVDYPATKAVFQDINGLVTVPTFATSSTTSTTPVLSFNASNTSFASGATVSGNYLQFLLQNKSGTAGASTNYVLSNDLGTDSTYYGEFGMNSSVFSASTPTDFFSINNGVYFSGHDGDITVGSGNGFKTYLAWGTTGQSAHVINASGALGFSTNLGTTPALSGTNGYGTAGQVLFSAGNAAAPAWGSLTPAQVSDQTNTSTGAFSFPRGTTAQRPGSPATGWARWNSDLSQMEFWNGTSWTAGWNTAYTIDYLVVAGGGSGGSEMAGGGGAGGYIAVSSYSVNAGQSFSAVVGAGGTGVPNSYGTNGNNSSFGSVTTALGGGGGGYETVGGFNGGSGGGGGGKTAGHGLGTSGQGNNGGDGSSYNGYGAGGGGGASAVGGSTGNAVAGNGGNGSTWLDGTTYAGGGGGGCYSGGGGYAIGSGGTGGGGSGGIYGGSITTTGTAGGVNTGGGGGGTGYTGSTTSTWLCPPGGSGIVKIRYAGSTQRGTGGTVTITGGYVYHTFTTSGSFVA